MSTSAEIKSTLESLAERQAILSHINSVDQQIAEADKTIDELDKVLAKELKDFEKLQSMSIKGLFYKVLGNKEEQLEKERQEYLKANLQFKEAKESLELLEYERELMVKKVEDVEALKAHLAKLKSKREAEIMASNGEDKAVLVSLLSEMDDGHYLQKEISEAYKAGELAFKSLQTVISHLNQAIKWGQWDMMNNRGHYYDHMKNNAMDQAVQTSYRANQQLRLFQNELADIGMRRTDLELKVGNNGQFMDIFFDNLISDWIIQSKIKNAKASVAATTDKTKMIMASLEHEAKKIEGRLAQLAEQKDQLLSK